MQAKSYLISLLVLAGTLQVVGLPCISRKEEPSEPEITLVDPANQDQANKRQKTASSGSLSRSPREKPQQPLETTTDSRSTITVPLTTTTTGTDTTPTPIKTISADKKATQLSGDKKLDQLMSLLLAELPTLDIGGLNGGDGSKKQESSADDLSYRFKSRTPHQLVYIDNSAYRSEKYTPCFFNAITCFPWIRNRHSRSTNN